jgi:hypothetical protein
VAVCSSVALLVCVGTAAATRTVRIRSHVSIASHGLTFSGRVTASNRACDIHRRVTLYRTNGNVLGHTTTSSTGRWKIRAQGSAGITLGRFYARVTRRSEGTAGTIYVCEAARSRTIRYHR